MRRAASALAVTIAVVALVTIGIPAFAAPAGGACQLAGTASFSPGLSNTAGNFTYSFSGDLTGCQSNAGAPATGTVEAGKIVTVGGEQFQEPISTGQGSCANGTTAGTAIARWADGTTTVIQYTTTAVAAAVNLAGNVISSVTIPAINPLPGQPTSLTITTTRFSGNSAQGALAFQASPQDCIGAGVTSAGITGAVGIGSPS